MPVDPTKYINPIIQAYLHAYELGQQGARAEMEGKLKEKQLTEEERRNRELEKQALDQEKRRAAAEIAGIKLHQAQLAAGKLKDIRDDQMKGYPIPGIPVETSRPINQPDSDLYNAILRQDPSSWGSAFKNRALDVETAPEIQIGETTLPAMRAEIPTPEAIQEGIYGLQAPLIKLKEREGMNRALSLEAFRAQHASELQGQRAGAALELQDKKDAAALERAKILAAARKAAGIKEDKQVTLAEAATYGVPVGTSYGDLAGKIPSKPLTVNEEDKLNVYTSLADRLVQIKELSDRLGWPTVFKPVVGNLYSSAQNVLGSETPEAAEIRRNVGEIKATIAKARAGTSFTPNEQALLETYIINLTDNPIRAQVKLQSALKDAVKNIEGLRRPATRREVTTGELTPESALKRGLEFDPTTGLYRRKRAKP